MIALICLLAVFGLGSCLEQLPSRLEIESSINRTIEEVERMVKADPSLPRLSRSEIVDILFNITSKDMDSYKDHVEKTREDYQRALMVVLPYNTNDSKDDSLKHLYTEAPNFRILSDPSETPKSDSSKSQSTNSNNSIDTKTKKSEDLANESANHYKNHRETYSEVSSEPPSVKTINQLLKNEKKQESPEKFTFNLAHIDSSTQFPGSKNSLKNRGSPSTKPNIQIVYSTSVTEKPITTKMIVHTTEINVQDFRPTMPPTRSTQNVLTSDQWRYNAPPATTTTTTTTKSSKPSVVNNKEPLIYHFLPTMMTESDEKPSSTTRKAEATTKTFVEVQKSQEMDFDINNLRILHVDEKPAPFYVTPMSSTSATKLETSLTTANTPSVSKTMTPMREEVQTLLASIGLSPKDKLVNDEKKNHKVQQDEDKIFGGNFHIPETNDVIRGQPYGFEGAEVASPSNSQNVYENPPKDVGEGVSNLSPDVQLLFQRFGLQTSKNANNVVKKTTTTTEKPRSTSGKSSFWDSFKPLPASEVRDEGMKEFLAKFGLGPSSNRNEKAMKGKKVTEERRPSLIDAVPGNMRQILENIGLIRKPQKPVTPKIVIGTTESPHLHVFKPHETSLDNEKQRVQINALLDTVKQVQEGKADVVAVQKAAKELLETTKSLKNGPDPLSLEEILKIYNDDVKNEIKRQQNPKDLAEMASSESSNISTTAAPETTTSSSGTSSFDSSGASSDSSAASSDTGSAPVDSLSIDLLTNAKNTGAGIEVSTTESPNLDALADSFGGSTAAPDPVLPTRRKTGLYFLVDWNTFLEVGEEEKDKVNLRFAPKAGDRTRFISVAVP